MGIDKDIHLKCWWEGTIKPTETATQWVGRLLDTGHNCIEYCSTLGEMMDLFTMEHALRMQLSHIASWVRWHKPKTAKEVGTWVDQYLRERNLDHSVLCRQHRWTPDHRPSGVGNRQAVPTTPESSQESDPSRKLTPPNRLSNKVTDRTKHHNLTK